MAKEDSPNKHNSDDLDRLERQLAHGGFFTHTVLSKYAARINEHEAFLFGLIDQLIEKGLIKKEELDQQIHKVHQEIHQKGEALNPGVALRFDRPDLPDPQPVNCAERLHVCKAICCKLNFALSAEEVESGKIKWELGHPYFIRHEKSGYCTHLNAGKCQCSIYQNRPDVCKRYSCAKDTRIWKDFDKMELNQDWIKANLSDREKRLFFVKMDPNEQKVTQKPKS